MCFALLALPSVAQAQPASIWHAWQWHLWRIEVDGSGLRPLDETPHNRCGSPVWSPDGKRIAYDFSDASISTRIVVIDAEGSPRRVLADGAIPSWSPDGNLILFQRTGKVVMDTNGRGIEVLPGPAFGLRWSPQGNRIASVGSGGITMLDLDTGTESVVFSGADPVYHGYDISSDGLRICYGSHNAGLCLATIDPDTMKATVERLVPTGRGFHASWAPDDQRIVFAWQQNPASLIQLYFYDTATGDEPVPVPGLDRSRHNVNPDWSPDGQSIVFSTAKPWN